MIEQVKSLKITDKNWDSPLSNEIEHNKELKVLFDEGVLRINNLRSSSIINRAEPSRLLQVIPQFPSQIKT